MSETNPTAVTPPKLHLDTLILLLSDKTRWLILRELAQGQALPPIELAKRFGKTGDSVQKHLVAMREMGVVKQVVGRLYSLAPAYLPDPATGSIEFGHALVRLRDLPA